MSKNDTTNKSYGSPGGGDVVYGLGLVGAAVFYIQNAIGFWGVILALLKALVWPAFVVYDVLRAIT